MNKDTLPRHVAIIPDGNRRWAKERMLPPLFGHREGYARTEELVQEMKDLGVSCVTLWAFSTENWKRADNEKQELFSVIKEGLESLHANVLKKQSRFVHLGRKDRLGNDLLELINTLEEETKEYTSFTLCVALDYGGEDELVRAGLSLAQSGDTTKTVVDFLDTTQHNVPPVDFVIRTSGEKRTSGFMPVQSAYAEWYFSPLYFPQFTVEELHTSLAEYATRERRLGR